MNNGQAYWKKNLQIITFLLAIWALVSYVAAILLAEPLYHVWFFKLPLSFWFAQQGSEIIFIILIFVYAAWMNKVDQEFGVAED